MQPLQRAALVSLVMAVLTLASGAAWAEYPERPVTVVVAYDLGGSTDVTARLLAPFLARHLGPRAEVQVVNRPGATGEVGFAAIADAQPDGYTIGFINTPNMLTPPIERVARYSIDRLDPLVNVADDPGVWTVPADSPYATLKDLIQAARSKPGTIMVGSTGVGSDDHLALLMTQQKAKVSFAHKPFAGSAANYRAMEAGRIQVCGHNLAEALRARQSDPIRILGVMSESRWPEMSDVPTFAEQGVAVISSTLRGVGAPQGVPPAIRAKLVAALTAAVNDPEFRALAARPGSYIPLRFLPPDAFAAEIKRQDAALHDLWRTDPWVR